MEDKFLDFETFKSDFNLESSFKRELDLKALREVTEKLIPKGSLGHNHQKREWKNFESKSFINGAFVHQTIDHSQLDTRVMSNLGNGIKAHQIFIDEMTQSIPRLNRKLTNGERNRRRALEIFGRIGD